MYEESFDGTLIIDESVPDSPAVSFSFAEENVLAYIAGYLGKRFKMKQHCEEKYTNLKLYT